MNIITDYEWRTHLPLLRYFIGEYSIKRIVEHGIGLHSTELFLSSSNGKDIVYHAYEENVEMIDFISKRFNVSSNTISKLEIPASNITSITKHRELSPSSKELLGKIHDELRNNIGLFDGLSLLLVDGYTCSRTSVINKLYDLFDIIIYHDAEPDATSWYEYYFEKGLLENYDHYKLTTFFPWTGFFLKKDFPLKIGILNNYIKIFAKESNIKITNSTIVNYF